MRCDVRNRMKFGEISRKTYCVRKRIKVDIENLIIEAL